MVTRSAPSAIRMIEAWATQGAVGADFCKRYFPRAEVLVIGHFHWQGCWRRDGRLVIDIGSFTNPGRAEWVEWNGGWLTHGQVEESPDACRLGRRLGVWKLQS